MSFLQFRTLAAALALSIGLAPFGAGAEETDRQPWKDWQEAFTLTVQADQFQKRGNPAEAIRLFQSAKATFQKVKITRPDWNQELIDSRIADCDAKIANLQALLPAAAAAMPAVVAPVAPAAAAADVVAAAANQELTATKEKLFRALTELDDLRRELRNNQAGALTIESLMQEKRLLLEQHTLLQQQYQTLQNQLGTPDKEKDDLRNQLVGLQLNYDLLNRRGELMEAKLNELNDELATAYQARNQARQETKSAGDRVAQLERELALLNGRTQSRDDALVKAEAQLAGLAAERDDFRTQLAAKQTEYDQLFQRFSANTSADQTAALLASDLKSLHQKFDELQRDYSNLNTDYRAARDQYHEQQLAATRQSDTLQKLAEQHKILQLDYKALEERFAQQGTALELSNGSEKQATERANILDNEVRTLRMNLTQLEERLKAREITDLHANETRGEELKTMRAALDDAQKNYTALEAQSEALKKRLNEAESRNAETRQEFITLKAQNASLTIEARKVEELIQRGRELEAELAAAALEPQRLQQLLTAAEAERTRLEQALTEARAATPIAAAPAVVVPGGADRPALAVSQPVKRVLTDDEIAAGLQAAAQALAVRTPDLALWEYQRILKSQPDHPEANRQVGELYLAEERYLEAVKYLQKAHARTPDDLLLTALWSRALSGSGEAAAGWDAVAAPLAANPDHYELQVAAARALTGLNRLAEAETALRHALELRPPAPELQLELVRLLITADRDAEAAELYQLARQNGALPDPQLEELLGMLLPANRELSRFLTAAGQEAMARQDWTSAAWYCSQLATLEPKCEQWHTLLAYVELKRGDAGAAANALAAAQAAAPTPTAEVEALRLALSAACYLTARQPEEALKRYRSLAELQAGQSWNPPAEFAGLPAMSRELLRQLQQSPDMAQAVVQETEQAFAQTMTTP